MKEFFAYPVVEKYGSLEFSDNVISFFTEEVFINSKTHSVEAGSKPVLFLHDNDFSRLFGEIPGIEGRKVSTD